MNVLIATLGINVISREIVRGDRSTRINSEFMIQKLKVQTILLSEHMNVLKDEKMLEGNGVGDVPCAACFLAKDCDAIQADTSNFEEKSKIKDFPTEDLLKWRNRSPHILSSNDTTI